jgi:hypothetical protein
MTEILTPSNIEVSSASSPNLDSQPGLAPEDQSYTQTQLESWKQEEAKKIELQLDTEELLAGLGAVGIGRLRHPFKTARILAVAAKRIRKGEYSPGLAQAKVPDSTSGFFDPFDKDPFDEARWQRRRQRTVAEERRRMIEKGQYIDPFEDNKSRW